MVPAVDADFVTFINEFLFNAPPQGSILRHQRTPPRHKRYRTMWRAAATSLMRKRYSSQETHLPFADHFLRELPSQVFSIDSGNSSEETHLPMAHHLLGSQASIENGHSSQQTTCLLSADNPLRKLPLEVPLDEDATNSSAADHLPYQVFLDDGHSSKAINSLSTDQLLRYLRSQCSLDHGGGGLATFDSPQHNHNRIDVDAAGEPPFMTPSCSKSAIKGSPSGCCSKAQPREATSTPAIPKHSSRKPPRPLRGGVPRSGSYRVIRLKNAARRATMENARIRKQKLSKSTLNATSMWALIITLCFASIMLVQGFLGNKSKNLDSRAEGQLVGEGISSLSPRLGVPPFTSGSSTPTFVAELEAGPILDQSEQKKRRDLPFMNRLRRLGATSWLLL